MLTTGISFLLLGVAFIVTTLVYPYVLKFARDHDVVDNPDARKLQRVPVPVMGGTTVFIGLLVSVLICFFISGDPVLLKVLGLLAVMYLLGAVDDIKDISPSLRFLIESLVVWLMVLFLDVEINDFHGFLGIHKIPDAASVPLSLIAGVGIINGVNLIDGVDGYCSTYGAMACALFAIMFFYCGDMVSFTLALIAIGALIPFFFHNVFGKSSKMFLGDGGSLMLGTLLTYFTFVALTSGSPCDIYDVTGLSLVAICLAVLAVPVFDTLRVMSSRMLHGVSPFHPDKTHLHHMFIELNYSHLLTSGTIVLGNGLIIVLQVISWLAGASINFQVFFVIALALLLTWVLYFVVERERRKNDGEGSDRYRRWCERGKALNLSRTRAWMFIRNVVDSRFFAGKAPASEDVTSDQSPKPPRIDPRIG